jgi:hypothetical protein
MVSSPKAKNKRQIIFFSRIVRFSIGFFYDSQDFSAENEDFALRRRKKVIE